MSLYYCSITGEPAEVPVISKKTGHIYERRVIEKYIDANQTDPITNQPLTRDDIINLQVSNTAKPRPVNATGVPELMSIFQSEWDALIHETYALRQNLESVRQELSHTLYQHDAACRVIARLTKERDEAKYRLAEFARDGQQPSGMEEELEKTLPQQVRDQIAARKAELNTIRKDRKKNKGYADSFASPLDIHNFKVTTSVALHSTTKPGITALDIHPDLDDLLVTGGNDGVVAFYNKAQKKVINTFEKHSRKITDAKFVPSNESALCLVSSEDGIGHLLSVNAQTGEITTKYRVDSHRDALVACAVHPLSTIGLFGARDGSFSYHDLSQGRLVSYVSMEGYHLNTLRVHPDGHIAALAGHDGTIRIWNVLEHNQIAEIKAHDGPIDSLSFSENGVNFATGSIFDKTVKLWDLRNLGEGNFKIVDDNSGGVVNFDRSGNYLAVGTTALRLYNVKELDEFTRFDNHQDVITGIQFGGFSKSIATVSLDRYLNIYS